MDTNALYYTLSTIAQTLAGALAVLVAVVLFKLSSLSKEQEVAAEILHEHGVDADVYLPIARKRGYDAMVAEALTRGGLNIAPIQRVRRACAAATAAYKTWGRINLPLYIALGFTVLDIALCFIALPYVPNLARSQCGACVILALAVGLGIICLGLYVWLIVSMVKRPAD
ncbi:MAG: hypothetical protein ACREMY_05860 [bacterium]